MHLKAKDAFGHTHWDGRERVAHLEMMLQDLKNIKMGVLVNLQNPTSLQPAQTSSGGTESTSEALPDRCPMRSSWTRGVWDAYSGCRFRALGFGFWWALYFVELLLVRLSVRIARGQWWIPEFS